MFSGISIQCQRQNLVYLDETSFHEILVRRGISSEINRKLFKVLDLSIAQILYKHLPFPMTLSINQGYQMCWELVSHQLETDSESLRSPDTPPSSTVELYRAVLVPR